MHGLVKSAQVASLKHISVFKHNCIDIYVRAVSHYDLLLVHRYYV